MLLPGKGDRNGSDYFLQVPQHLEHEPQHDDDAFLQQESPVPQQPLVVLQEEKPKSMAAADAVRMKERISFIIVS